MHSHHSNSFISSHNYEKFKNLKRTIWKHVIEHVHIKGPFWKILYRVCIFQRTRMRRAKLFPKRDWNGKHRSFDAIDEENDRKTWKTLGCLTGIDTKFLFGQSQPCEKSSRPIKQGSSAWRVTRRRGLTRVKKIIAYRYQSFVFLNNSCRAVRINAVTRIVTRISVTRLSIRANIRTNPQP